VTGSKRHKQVRFADDLEFVDATGHKQGQQQQQQRPQGVLGRVKKGSSSKAARCAAAMDLGPAVPGEVGPYGLHCML
jgi:hypothetical protein